MVCAHAGVTVSSNGIDWQRGHGSTEGARGQAKEADVGRVLAPNQEDWWWLDTRHLSVSDVQVCRSSSMQDCNAAHAHASGDAHAGVRPPCALTELFCGV